MKITRRGKEPLSCVAAEHGLGWTGLELGITFVKNLLLLRHAKSGYEEPQGPDQERSLTPRGHAAAALMASFLREQSHKPQWRPDLVLVSMARRTRQTFDHFAPTLSGVEVCFEAGLYAFAALPVLLRLRALPESVGTVLVIGHNPALHDVTLDLARNHDSPLYALVEGKFPTAALAHLQHDGTWNTLGAMTATLSSFTRPKDLGNRDD